MKRLGKFLLVLVIIGAIVFGVGYWLKSCAGGNEEPPTISEAPYKVTAGGRYYFTKDYEEGTDYFGKYVTMHGYYYITDDLKWVYKSGTMPLSERAFDNLDVAKRHTSD